MREMLSKDAESQTVLNAKDWPGKFKEWRHDASAEAAKPRVDKLQASAANAGLFDVEAWP